MAYFIIHNSEDGEVSVHQMDAEELQKKIEGRLLGDRQEIHPTK